jgi:hypothetical protein
MKDIKQIAADCGIEKLADQLKRRVETEPFKGILSDIDTIIGALYRRIEKLEEEKAKAKQLVTDCANDINEYLGSDAPFERYQNDIDLKLIALREAL